MPKPRIFSRTENGPVQEFATVNAAFEATGAGGQEVFWDEGPDRWWWEDQAGVKHHILRPGMANTVLDRAEAAMDAADRAYDALFD